MMSEMRGWLLALLLGLSGQAICQTYERTENYYGGNPTREYRAKILQAILKEDGLDQFSFAQLSSVVLPPPGDTGWAPVWTPIVYAVAHGREKSFRTLLNRGVSLNVEIARGKTLMHLAASAGSGEIIRILAAKGLDINKRDKFGRSPFRYAALGRRYGRYAGIRSAVNALLDLGAESTPNERGFAVDCACQLDYHPERNTGSSYTDDPADRRDQFRTCERLLRLGVARDEDIYKRIPGQEDDPEWDNWAIVRRDVLSQMLIEGDLPMLKMVAKYTPGWPKSHMPGPDRFSAVDLAAYAENWHVVRWLRSQGFPKPKAFN